jgi:hypothetical protein
MCNFQLSPQNYENEKKKIFEIGRVNGYPSKSNSEGSMKTPDLAILHAIVSVNKLFKAFLYHSL